MLSGDTRIGGGIERWVGVGLLMHFAVVCAIKIARGVGEEILWFSHVALMLAGIGLVRRSALLPAVSLTLVLVLEGLFLLDWVSGLLFQVYPLNATGHLKDENLWGWIATAHHFYLVPLLLVLVTRSGRYPARSLSFALSLAVSLIVVSRLWLPPSINVNYAYGLLLGVNHPVLLWVNGLSEGPYLLAISVIALILLFPSSVLLRRLARTNAGSSTNVRSES